MSNLFSDGALYYFSYLLHNLHIPKSIESLSEFESMPDKTSFQTEERFKVLESAVSSMCHHTNNFI
jgi:hypothetical protein